MTEEELCQRCRKGDEAARRLLYEQYAKPMLGVCFRYAGDRRTAEDWLHDAFLKIYCSIDKFAYQGEGSLKAWGCSCSCGLLIYYMSERTRKSLSPKSILGKRSDPSGRRWLKALESRRRWRKRKGCRCLPIRLLSFSPRCRWLIR